MLNHRILLTAVLMFSLGLLIPKSLMALEYDLKITTSVQAATFTQEGEGDQEDPVAMTQIKPDLALFLGDATQLVIAPRGRWGITDSEYHLISIDDGYVEYVSERYEFRLGYQTFFWGTVESQNIVDILNQEDFIGDFLDPEKIGEPSLRVRTLLGETRIDLFAFFYFTPAPLPGKVNRYNFFDGAMDISDDPFYTSSAKRGRQQVAARLDHTIGSADFGVAYFNGYEKFPVVFIQPGASDADTLYYEMQQISGDLQMSLGNWLIKLEGLYQDTGISDSITRDILLPDGSTAARELVPKDHAAFAGGWEYTLFGVLGKSDLGLFAEYLYDSEQSAEAVAFRPFQNDVFAGLRWTWNNPGDGKLLAGIFSDLRHPSRLWRVEYSERYFERIKLFTRVDLINADEEDPLSIFNNDDRVSVELSYTY